VTFAGSPVANSLPRSRGVRFSSRYAGVRPHTPREGARGGRAEAVGCGVGRAAERLGYRARRGHAPGTGGAAPSPTSRRLRGRPHRAAARRPVVGGSAGLRGGCGAQSPQRGSALGALAVRRAPPRSDRPRVPGRGPGDPPAPCSFPRCPGHHQPRGHTGHDGAPHTAGYRRRRPRPSPRAGARTGRTPSALRPTSDRGRHGQVQRAPRNERAGQGDEPRAQVDPQRLGSGVPEAHTQGGPPRAARQRALPRPRPRPLRARLPLAGAPGDRRGRRWETHRTRQAFQDDRAKDAALPAAGSRVLRFTTDVDPDTAARRLRALLPTAGTRPRSGSPAR
jgi:hypothetical protein